MDDWYRSIEAYQKKTGYRFLRGGSRVGCVIHGLARRNAP